MQTLLRKSNPATLDAPMAECSGRDSVLSAYRGLDDLRELRPFAHAFGRHSYVEPTTIPLVDCVSHHGDVVQGALCLVRTLRNGLSDILQESIDTHVRTNFRLLIRNGVQLDAPLFLGGVICQLGPGHMGSHLEELHAIRPNANAVNQVPHVNPNIRVRA